MNFFYSPRYDLGRGLPMRTVHGFVLDRPSRTKAALINDHGVDPTAFTAPPLASLADFEVVHSARVLASLRAGDGVARAVEMPFLRYLPSMMTRRAVVDPQVAAAGGTVAAIRAAADGAWSANLSGGFHHARPDLAHGFCLVNDVALAVAVLRRDGLHRKFLTIDLDAHQGDGNAAAFDGDNSVMTVSLHEQALFPHPKLGSTIDVGLRSGIGDDDYLGHVEATLNVIGRRFKPDIVVYVAGVDPFVGDPLSTLRVSKDGLRRRDEHVARFARTMEAGLVVLPAGGYTADSPGLSAAGMAVIAQLAP